MLIENVLTSSKVKGLTEIISTLTRLGVKPLSTYPTCEVVVDMLLLL